MNRYKTPTTLRRALEDRLPAVAHPEDATSGGIRAFAVPAIPRIRCAERVGRLTLGEFKFPCVEGTVEIIVATNGTKLLQ